MALVNVTPDNTFEEWRVKTNEISSLVGDISTLTSQETNLVSALNNVRDIDIVLNATGEVTGTTTLVNLEDASIELVITDGSVVTAKLNNLAVTTEKINDLAVTTGKINDLAVTTGKINDLGVTTGKINDLAVTTGKINNLATTTEKINDLAVTTGKLAAGAVTSAKLNNVVTLQILNSSGSAVKTLYGAGT